MKLLVLGMALALAAAAGCYGTGEVAPTDTAPTPSPSGDAGTVADSSGPTPAGVDVFGGSSTCTSQKNSTAREGSTMRPGEACIACHTQRGEGTIFLLAGTVYPTGHEPDDCVGATSTDIQVIATDATGKDFPMAPNGAGNFTLGGGRTGVAFQMPYTARVERGGKIVEAMGTKQTVGDCNSCHTDTGANGAPGRIAAPLPP